MKKNILMVLLVVLVCLTIFSGYKESVLDELQSSETNISEKPKVTFNTPKSNEVDISSDDQDEGYGGGIITVQKYRSCYYSIPSTFVELVGREVYYEWINTVDYTESAEKMIMLQFVQHFDISREQFDKANYKIAKIILEELDGRPCMNPKDYANQICDEIYNGDIIYTFDDVIINAYYLSPDYPYLYSSEYDEAVAKGIYETRTTDWVDVEQMEAEIIAKYGEIEQTEDEVKSTESVDFFEETTFLEQTESGTIE